MSVALKEHFGVNFMLKMDPTTPPEASHCTKMLSFWCHVTMGTIIFDDVSEK